MSIVSARTEVVQHALQASVVVDALHQFSVEPDALQSTQLAVSRACDPGAASTLVERPAVVERRSADPSGSLLP